MQDRQFQELLRESNKVEVAICQWYQENLDQKTRLAIPHRKEYDIICEQVGNVEVKWDKLAVKTGSYAFEIEDASGQSSGLKASTAGEFVIVDDDYVIFIKTTTLLFLIRDCVERRLIKMGYTTRDGNRAIGYLVPRNTLLYSPYVRVLKRWF